MREAVLHLSDTQLAKLGLDDVVASARDAGLRDVTELVCHGPGGIVLLQVAAPIPETDLDRFESVDWWERLATSPDEVTYLCKISPPDHAEPVSIDEYGITHDVADVRENGIDISIVGSQEDISQGVAAVDEAGVTALLRRLTDYRGPSSPTAALTDRQHEVARTAFAMGYYDVPRQASTAEVAAELGLDDSTVSEHLQRAERNLMAAVLGED